MQLQGAQTEDAQLEKKTTLEKRERRWGHEGRHSAKQPSFIITLRRRVKVFIGDKV